MKKNSSIKAILFDMGNVLLKYDARKAATRFAKACDVPVSRVWLHFFTSPVEKAYTRGEITTYEFFRHSKKALRSAVTYKVFKHFWNDIFWENPGMETLLKKLKKRYSLYVISNTNKMHWEHIKKEHTLFRHFKRTFPSHEVGHRKPDVDIYKKVLKKIRFRPEETIFIDDVPKFVAGAKKVGMNAIRFRTRVQLVRDLKRYEIRF